MPSIPTEKPVKQSNEQRYFDALRTISRNYDTAEQVIRNAERRYGLDGFEALQMVYENIQNAAENAIRGKRRPKV